MSISIIMPTLDKERYLPFTLASLRAQTYRDFQLVVVDDGGSGAVADLLRRHAPDVDVVYQREPHRGRAATRNAGLRRADGELVVFLDDDRIVRPDFLAAHQRCLADSDDVAAIGWKRRALTLWLRRRLSVVEADFTALLSAHGPAAAWLTTDEHQVIEPDELAADPATALSRIDLGDDLDNHGRVIDMFSDDLTGFWLGWTLGTTGNLAVHAAALRDIGGFDETFAGWGVEDVDLCYRLSSAGVRFRINREAVNYHQLHPPGPGRVSVELARRRAEALANAQRFCARHDTLETYLYWQVFSGTMSVLDANLVLVELARAKVPAVEAELTRLYRQASGLAVGQVSAVPGAGRRE